MAHTGKPAVVLEWVLAAAMAAAPAGVAGRAAGGEEPDTQTAFRRAVHVEPNEHSGSPGDEAMIRATGDDLVAHSPTFAALIAMLSETPDVTIFLRPARLRGLIGRGQFRQVGTRTIGVIEIQPFAHDPHERVRALAHELAHAYEVACAKGRSTATGADAVLVAYGEGRPGPRQIETTFAPALAAEVLREYRTRGASSRPSRLAALAAEHGLPACGPV
jgi:hypothetical protein